MKRTFILLAAALAFSHPVLSQAKEQGKKAVIEPVATAEDANNLVTEAKQKLISCNKSFQVYRIMMQAADMARQAREDSEDAERRAGYSRPKQEAVTDPQPQYLVCIASAKEQFVPSAKVFIKSVKSADTQRKAKDMIAQWITAIDAVGSSIASTEQAKFETQANSLMLEF